VKVPYLTKQDLFDLDFDLTKDEKGKLKETDQFPIFQQIAGEDDGVWISIKIPSRVVKKEVCGLFLMELPEMEAPMGSEAASQWGEE